MSNQWLIQARARKVWSPEEASDHVGVAEKTYRTWEAGTRIPQMRQLKLLCRAFNDTVENLGYIIDENGHIRLKPPEEDFTSIDGAAKLTDDLAQAHEGLLESVRRSLKRFSGTVSSSKKASALDRLMRTVLFVLAPLLNMASVGVGLWLSDRVSKLGTAIGPYELRLTSQQYLVIVHTEIESWKRMIDEDYQTTEAYYYTRRTAIENLVLFPASLLTAVQWSSRTDFVAQEFLIQCAPCHHGLFLSAQWRWG